MSVVLAGTTSRPGEISSVPLVASHFQALLHLMTGSFPELLDRWWIRSYHAGMSPRGTGILDRI